MKRVRFSQRLAAAALSAVMLAALLPVAALAETDDADTLPSAPQVVEEQAGGALPSLTVPGTAGTQTAGDTAEPSAAPDTAGAPAAGDTGAPSAAPQTADAPAAEDPQTPSAAPEPTDAPTGERVQAFLAAVDAIVLPDEINEETGPVLNEQIGAAMAAYEALGGEELAREDVQAALALLQEAEQALTGGVQTLEEPAGDAVAMIGETGYGTLNEAIGQAQDGDTITLLRDCALSANAKVSVNHNITIQGTDDETITVIADKLPGDRMIEIKTGDITKGLTLKDCKVDISNIPASGYGYNAAIIINGGKLVLDHCDMTIDGLQADGTYNNMHGFWCLEGGDNLLSVVNGSNLVVKNFAHNALEWDGTTKYLFEVKDSTYTADHTRGGIIGTWDVTFENAVVNVTNSSTNGSNGSNYTITNSVVNFKDNGAHGLSAGNVQVQDSLITCAGNKYTGFHVAGTLDAKTTGTGPYTTKIDVTGNSWNTWNNDLFAGMRLIGNATAGSGVTINVSDNYGVGIRASGTDSTYTFEEGVSLTVTQNGKPIESGTQYNTTGGGIWNRGTMTLPKDAAIYNNHAVTAGDDLYSTGTLTFGAVGDGWALDGAPDCEDAIDGWYDDPKDSRWEAHDAATRYVKEFAVAGQATAEGLTALKAAHGMASVPPVEPEDPAAPRWDVSKSKTATNLDENFESTVTLSLPAKEEPLVTDVVFVLDESSCSEPVKAAVGTMLETLHAQAEQTGATIQIGAVQFRGEVTTLPLTELTQDTKTEVTSFMSQRPATGGSNMSAGLLAGEKMLDADDKAEASRKYLILVSDGITYIWDDETTDAQENIGVNFANGDTQNTPMLAGPDGWDVKHSNGYVPASWAEHLAGVKALADATISDKSSVYERSVDISDKPFVAYGEKESYASTVDLALYKSYLAYQRIASKYPHTYAVMTGVEKEMATYPFGPSFMEYLAGGESPSFDQILKEIIYLVDKGSQVVDYIGYAENDYDFDFVNEAARLSLKVGDQTYQAEASGENTYQFANGDYTLTYLPGNGREQEHFVWQINVPVSNFAPVQLTYAVRLANPKTVDGTYGEYDADGGRNLPGLYTNNSAVLYPVDSNGEQHAGELFAKPTVSYTVSTPKPVEPTPTPSATPAPTPSASSTPSASPAPSASAAPTAAPSEAPTQTAAPTPTVQPAQTPQTGDDFNPVVWTVVMLAALAALAGVEILRRTNKR